MIHALLVAALLQAQPASPTATLTPPSPQPSASGAEAGLVDAAIADFRAYPPGPLGDFRAVRVGRIRHTDRVVRPLLCGEVQIRRPGEQREWVRFATVETAGGHEQWIGAAAATWCNAETSLDPPGDLAARFRQALVAP